MRLRLLLFFCLSLLTGVAQAAPVATLNSSYRPLHFGDYNYDITPSPAGGGGNLVIGSAGLNTDWGKATSLTRIMEGEPWSPLMVGLTITGLPSKWSYQVSKPAAGAFESMRIGGGSGTYDAVNGVWLQDYNSHPLAGAWETRLQRPSGDASFDTEVFQLGGSCQFTGNQFGGTFGLYWRDLPLTVKWFNDKGALQGSQTLNVRYSVRIGPGIPQLVLESAGVDMHFGTLIASSLAGSVELGQFDTRKATGGVKLYAGGTQARAGIFRLRNNTPTRTYGGLSLTLPNSATLTQVDGSGNPLTHGATMTVRNFGTTLTVGKETKNVASGTPGIFSTVPGTNAIDFRVGAVLDVAANQPSGNYSGTYTLTVVNY